MATMVIFNGQVCWLNTGYSVQVLSGDETDPGYGLVFELVAVESASVRGRYKGAFVKTDSFLFLPSSIQFEDSEWSQGVSNADFNA